MHRYGQSRFKRLHPIPKNGLTRRVNNRDRAIGVAAIVVLLVGFWWAFLKTDPYVAIESDVYGAFGWVDREVNSSFIELAQTNPYNFHPAVVLVVFEGGEKAASLRADQALREIRSLGSDFPDAKIKRFANVIVVCGLPADCRQIELSIESNARERIARENARNYL